MRFFENRVLSVGDSGRALLARIVEEGEAAFSTPLNDPQTMQLARREDAPFGAEQLIGSSIEQLLIGFIRRGADEAAAAAKPTSVMISPIICPVCRANIIKNSGSSSEATVAVSPTASVAPNKRSRLLFIQRR